MVKRKSAAVREEVPTVEIGELALNVPEVQVKVMRINAGNRRTSLGWVSWATEKVGGPEFEKWLAEEYGGGIFIIEMCNRDNTNERLVPAFKIHLEGDPKPSATQQAKFEQAAVFNAQRGLAPPDLTAFMRSPQGAPPLRADGKPMAPQPSGVNPRDIATHTSDVAFKHQADTAEARLYRIEQSQVVDRKEREKERRDFEAERRAHMQQVSDLKEVHRKEEAQKEREIWEAKMTAMTQQATQAPKIDYAGVLTAAVPLLVAFFSSNKDQKALSQQEHFKSIETQQKNMDMVMKMIGSKASGESETLKALTPMLTKIMDNDSPKAQASMLQAMGDHQTTMLSLVHQMMIANQPENPPPWMTLAEEAIGQLSGVAGAYADAQKVNTGAGEAVAAAIGTAVAPTPPAGPETPMSPEEVANALLAHPQWPQEMRNDDWRQLVTLIHDQHDVNVVAGLLFDHFDKLDRANETPTIFVDIWREPERIFSGWLAVMPIIQAAPEYAQELAKLFVDLVMRDIQAQEGQEAQADAESGPTNGVSESEPAAVVEEPAQAVIVDIPPAVQESENM